MTVHINNWKDVSSQFGFDKNPNTPSAMDIRKLLKVAATKSVETHYFVPCSYQSDAIACFVVTQRTATSVNVDYQGTAN